MRNSSRNPPLNRHEWYIWINMRHPSLGQHFLTRPEIAGWVADAIKLGPEHVVLEIGPGHGILTRELLQRAGKVVALERDTALVEELRTTFAAEVAEGRLVLLQGDVRSFRQETCADLENGYVVVANIPYYITGKILRMFLTADHQPNTMVLLVQKEVAERIVVKEGKHSLLSLSVQAYGTPEYVRTVKAGSFSPPPKVDSAILAIHAISRDRFSNSAAEQRFFECIHAGFASKRKVIGKQIEHLVPEEALERCDIPKNARAEDVPLERWLCLVV
jgi:16S rRNA (adenine1518-N6/adenine1519-N6)-dimethyltransferase